MIRLTHSARLLPLLGVLFATLVLPSHVHAQGGCITGSSGCTNAPEIDPSMVGQGGALLAGAFLLMRARKKS